MESIERTIRRSRERAFSHSFLFFSLVLVTLVGAGAMGCGGRSSRGDGRGGGFLSEDAGVDPQDASSPSGDGSVVMTPETDGSVFMPFPDAGSDAGSPDASPMIDAASCAPGLSLCNESCVDVVRDPSHCGACNAACDPGAECIEGGCEPIEQCAFPLQICNDACVDTSTDANHCGVCFNPCPSTTGECIDGQCVPDEEPIVGDTCADAMPVPAGGRHVFTFTGARGNHTPLSCGATTARPDVALRWTASASGTYLVRAFGDTSSVDVTLGVFSSSACSSATQLACDDDGGMSLDSRLEIALTGGTMYYFVVSSYADPAPVSNITLEITPL